MRLFVSLLILAFVFPACSKDDAEKDTVLPVVTISSPANGENFTSGQTIPVSGSITDNQFVAEVHIHVTNNNTGALLMDVHLYPGSSTTSFDQSITAVAGIHYKIQVLAKDRAVNEARSTVEVSCN